MSSHSVVTVSFPPLGQQGDYACRPGAKGLHVGALVVVEGLRGLAMGRVVAAPHVPRRARGGQLRKVVRPARDADRRAQAQAESREPLALRLMLREIRERRLPWKVLSVVADGVANQFVVAFSAPERQDAKDVARALGQALRARVLLRQMGPRDSAKVAGGLGRCGRELCCSTFLPDFPRTSIKMAKEQGMALVGDKTAGVCGRTLCCLSYEADLYAARLKWLPRMGKRATLVDGREGRVVSLDPLGWRFTFVGDSGREVLHASQWAGNEGKELPQEAAPAEAPVVAMPTRRPRPQRTREGTPSPSPSPPPAAPPSAGGEPRADRADDKPRRRRRRRKPKGPPSGKA